MWAALLVLIGLGIYYVLPGKSSYEVQTNTGAPAGEMKIATSGNPNIPVDVLKTPVPVAALKDMNVAIQNFAFTPSTLVVAKGTKVTWKNNDAAPHTVTSDSGNVLHSQTLSTGQTFSFTFTEAGTYNYHCSVHPGMTGKVVVE